MERIYSKHDPELLLHIIVREDHDFDRYGNARTDIIDPKEHLQCSALSMNAGKTFKPHKHKIHCGPQKTVAQESWVVLKGSVKCILYDIDDEIIAEPILYPGDASITLYGGHNYLILEDGTRVLEWKTGPYLGQYLDKEFIE